MKTMRDLALATLAAALLGGCGTLRSSAETGTPEPERETVTDTAAPSAGTPAETRLESRLVSLPFRVDITFSEAALAKLRETGASLGVSADYYGAPLDPSAAGLDPQLGVWLGGEMETIEAAARSVTMKGQVDAARVEREVRGDARVKVLVFPVRSYAAQSTIECSEFDEYLSLAVETGGVVHCDLTGK